MKKLEINGIINCENVVNALHRTFLLNQKIPKKLFKLATDEQVGFSKLELTELAELYRIVLQNRDGSDVNRICEKNMFNFLSHNSKVLQTRITEFTKTYSLTDFGKENLPKVKRQKSKINRHLEYRAIIITEKNIWRERNERGKTSSKINNRKGKNIIRRKTIQQQRNEKRTKSSLKKISLLGYSIILNS